MSDELRARVAKIFCADQNSPWPECVCSTKQVLACPECLMHADAAIALARDATLEEAAKAVDDMPLGYPGNAAETALECAAAIDLIRAETLEEAADRIAQLEAALREFCDRVDRGEVKSVTTYAKFKALLEDKA